MERDDVLKQITAMIKQSCPEDLTFQSFSLTMVTTDEVEFSLDYGIRSLRREGEE